jgi:hypothetical protein
LLATCLLLAGGSQLHAQNSAKILFGNKDFEMDWHLEPAGKLLRVRFLAATKRLRIEAMDGSEQVMLRDLMRGDVVILIAQGQKGAFTQKSAPMAPFAPQEMGETREIAGQTCRDFGVQGQKFCVTDDGIPVEVDFGNGKLTARSLVRQAQHPALFQVPKGLVLKPLPGAGKETMPALPF